MDKSDSLLNKSFNSKKIIVLLLLLSIVILFFVYPVNVLLYLAGVVLALIWKVYDKTIIAVAIISLLLFSVVVTFGIGKSTQKTDTDTAISS
jgi:4-hydroxybenzoate polyprenyltransferase